MTGRDLIIFVLVNNLEDTDIFENGRVPGLYTMEEYAAKMGVGPETVHIWAMKGMLDFVALYDKILIPVGAVPHDGRR